MLTYYRQYKIFPSEYVRDCVMTLLNKNQDKSNIPDCDIPELSLNHKAEPEKLESEP